MPDPVARGKTKETSDVFIHRLEDGAYSTQPSPFVIRKDLEEIQVRNLTPTDVNIRFKAAPVIPSAFTIRGDDWATVSIDASARPGVYEYKAQVATPAGPPGLQQLPRTYAQGQSSPKMIVDT